MASVDQLTGLYNRYKFTELFVSLYATMVKRENDMSLIMLDIDHFKNINDTYGHNIGDKVLVEISNILKQYFRNVDIVGRWGGEEFVVLVPTANSVNGEKIAEKIRIAIKEAKILDDLQVTASFGITEIKLGDKLEVAISRADEALYEAKNSGRDNTKIKL
jgi:diguanylate cyclase (GGDEF)-like protein